MIAADDPLVASWRADHINLLGTRLLDHTLPTKLRRVLASKDNVHYSPRLISKTDARALVRQARALLDAAERL